MSDNFSLGVAKVFMTSWGARFYAWRARRRGFQTQISDTGPGRWQELGGRYSVALRKDDTAWMNQPRFSGEVWTRCQAQFHGNGFLQRCTKGENHAGEHHFE